MSGRAARPQAIHCAAVEDGRVVNFAVKTEKRRTEVEEGAWISFDFGPGRK